MKNISIIIELCLIIAGLFAINSFVENVLDPDYTTNWQSRAEWKAAGGIGGMPRDKEFYYADIMRHRQTDRLAFFFLYGILIAGYYCAKAAAKEVKRRGVIIPADGTQIPDATTIASNRRIVLMRFVSLLLFTMVVMTSTILILGHPMQNINELGDLSNTNPYFGNEMIGRILFTAYMPLMICIAPYFAFRGITNILTLKFSLTLLAVLALIIVVCILLRVPQYGGSLIANACAGLGIFRLLMQKYNLLAKTLGM